MASVQELAQRRRRAQQQRTQAVFVPAPQGGINAIDGAGAVPPGDALYLYNLIPQEYGCAVRKGYREWCQMLPAGVQVKTIIPVMGQNSDAPVNKLFVANDDGIYDCSTEGGLPVRKVEWPIKSERAGWCSWHSYTTLAGYFMLLCDNENGYYLYTASTDAWTVGSITGPNPPEATLDFVTVWKNRVFFVQQSKGSAWYLPVGQITGAAKEFVFGNKFKYGGYLKSMWNFTVDGGAGIDDYLAVISSGGDLLIYKGTDIDTAGDFNLVGVWYIGKPTQGRRQCEQMGGDLLILSSYGLLQASKLIAGAPMMDAVVSISHKINPRINTTIDAGTTQYGWQIKLSPIDQLVLVLVPNKVGQTWQQFVYNTATRAWCQFVNVPMVCAENFNGRLFFGTDSNRVMVYEGSVDNVLVGDDGANATTIQWEVLTGYQTYGDPAKWKRVQFLRPRFIGTETPAYNIAARYDFDLGSLPPPTPTFDTSAALWDSGIWDNAKWGGSTIVTQAPTGGVGLGQHIAIAMRGLSAGNTIYLGCDLMLDMGGYL